MGQTLGCCNSNAPRGQRATPTKPPSTPLSAAEPRRPRRLAAEPTPPSAIRSGADGAKTSRWRYKAANHLPLGLRTGPRLDSPLASRYIQANEAFNVAQVVEGSQGVLFLLLADGSGWAFDRKPGIGEMCVREDAAAPAVFDEKPGIGTVCSSDGGHAEAAGDGDNSTDFDVVGVATSVWHSVSHFADSFFGGGEGTSLLEPLAADAPPVGVFPPRSGHHFAPKHSEARGPKQTNKFWTNWVTGLAGPDSPIWVVPYALKWAGGRSAKSLLVSHSQPQSHYDSERPGHISYYHTPFAEQFGISAANGGIDGHYAVVQESMMGIYVEARGRGGKVTFPIYSGMAYVSGHYTGGLTPALTSPSLSIESVSAGVWKLETGLGAEFRAFAIDDQGEFADRSYTFVRGDGSWRLSRPFNGWLRVARVVSPADRKILDSHARAIVVGVDVGVETQGVLRYGFSKAGATAVPVLHWAYAHHVKLMGAGAGAQTVVPQSELAPITTPTKGRMRGVLGDSWTMSVDLSEAARLDFLPEGIVQEPYLSELKDRTAASLRDEMGVDACLQARWVDAPCASARKFLLTGSFYYSGKGLQKLGSLCILAEKLLGRGDRQTQNCAALLGKAFRCFYARDSDCGGVATGIYDQDWGGIVNKQGYDNADCANADFGNACYNDHHYHFGYFVTAAAALVKLVPAKATDIGLVSFITTLIRDTANPSREDPFFPQFRMFDWFDLHSWSHGVVPMSDGKNQESLSEDINLYYGIQLWGRVMKEPLLEQLGTTMVGLLAATTREFFFMEDGNPHHHPDFVKNRVTGILFQNKAHYTTWFGTDPKHIHGIQMLPLTPALRLARSAAFCRQEWNDILHRVPMSHNDAWTSVILTGNLALIAPDRAYGALRKLDAADLDFGLSHAWALYWAAAMSAAGSGGGIERL